MDRVCLHEGIARFVESDGDDDEVVDVFHISADSGFREPFFHGGTNENVARGAGGDFGADVGV